MKHSTFDKTRIEKIYGDGVGATMVTVLWARAKGAQKYHLTGWDDPQARSVWDKLVEHGARHGLDPEDLVLTDRGDAVGTIRRSQAIDRCVIDFSHAHPGHFQVVTLGIGLCNRAYRLKDLDCTWFGLDRAPEIALRTTFIDEDVTILSAASVTEPGWLDSLTGFKKDCPTVFVAEGLFMYLTTDDVSKILTSIAASMTGPVWVVADSHHSWITNQKSAPPIAEKTGATYTFGIDSAEQLAKLGGTHWVPVCEIDTMKPISPLFHLLSNLHRVIKRAYAYSVKVIALS